MSDPKFDTVKNLVTERDALRKRLLATRELTQAYLRSSCCPLCLHCVSRFLKAIGEEDA
jgi:hypothetical protein